MRGSSDCCYCFGGSIPRSFVIASILGVRPRQAADILARSSVLPRDSTMLRKAVAVGAGQAVVFVEPAERVVGRLWVHWYAQSPAETIRR